MGVVYDILLSSLLGSRGSLSMNNEFLLALTSYRGVDPR
jgi:hypothetical protein